MVEITGTSATETRSGTDFMLAWTDSDVPTNITLVRVAPDGTPDRAASTIPSPDADSDPSIAWGDLGLGLAHATEVMTVEMIRFMVVDRMGRVTVSPMSFGGSPAPSSEPTLIWTGSEWGLAWRESTANLALVRIDGATGVPIGVTRNRALLGMRSRPSLLKLESAYYAAYLSDQAGPCCEVWVSRICDP